MRKHAIWWLCVLFLLLAFVLGPLSAKEFSVPMQNMAISDYRARFVEPESLEDTTARLSRLTDMKALMDSGALLAVIAAAVSGEPTVVHVDSNDNDR